MKPAAFDYYAPIDLGTVVETLAKLGSDAAILAGGQSLLPLMNLRLSTPRVLVDLRRVPGLAGIKLRGGWVEMGAMTLQADALSSPITQEEIPVLAEALRWVSHPAVRNSGTVGGSIAFADPAAELPLILTLLDGEVTIEGVRGRRTIGAPDLFVGPFLTSVREDEVITEVRWPRLNGLGWGFRELARRHRDRCIASAAAVLGIDDDRRVVTVRIALGGVSDRAVRIRDLEGLMVGEMVGEELFEEVARSASDRVNPDDDLHGSSAYRKQLVKILTRLALNDALERCER